MLPLFKAFFDICLLRLGPQDLPVSRDLLYLSLIAHAMSVLLLALVSFPFVTSLVSGVTDTLVLAGLTFSVLYMHGHVGRTVQTLTALAGTGALLGFLALVPSWWWYAARDSEGDPTLAVLLLLLMVVWSLVVMAHILRHALETRLFVGLVVAVVFYWVAVSVREGLFPLPQ